MTEPDHIEALADSVRSFVARGDEVRRARGLRDQQPGYDRDRWRAMAEMGWLGVLIPEEYGGQGLGLTEAATIAQGLARVLTPEPFAAAVVLAGGVLARGDNPSLKDRLLPAMVEGAVLPALAWQEANGSMDPLAVRCRIDNGCLSGDKHFIRGAGAADGFAVSAVGSDGLGLYWVEGSAPGVSVSVVPLADGTFDTTLTLRNTPAEVVASPAVAAEVLADTVRDATLIASAELAAMARQLLDITLEQLRTRVQFGKPIGSFQALQHRAVDGFVQIELADAVLREAMGAREAASASRSKARSAEAAALMGREAIQLHGAMGFTDDCDVGLFAKRIIVTSAWLGGAHFHRRTFSRLAPVVSEHAATGPATIDRALRDLPSDYDWNQLSDHDFRMLLRDFVDAYYPDALRHLPRRVRWHEVRDWNIKLAERGWIAPAWPREWGGMGLSPAKQLIQLDEFERGGVGRAPDQGVRQFGPVLMRYGTDAQKATYLPKILNCEHVWCQGYSEPNAGSDLASLTTSAVADGDEFVINGQKIWTSLATDATHIYVLCRTDKTVKPQAGLSFIIADLRTPGITIRPIRDIAGNEEFCHTIFENVRVPKDNLIGGLNRGWTVAKALLDFERLGVASPLRPAIALRRLTELGWRLGLFDDIGFVDEYTRLRLNLMDHATLFGRFADLARRGEDLGPEVSVLKIWGMEQFQRVSEFALERADAFGGAAGPGKAGVDLMTPYYMSRLTTIGGGSNEIQRNVLAKRVLRLPG